MRGGSTAIAFLALGSGLSCDATGLTVVPPPPIGTGVRAMVLAIDTGDSFEVHAIEVIDGRADDAYPLKLAQAFDARAHVRLEVASYGSTLAELGLKPGLVPPATGAQPVALREAPKYHRFDVTVSDSSAGAWTESSEMSPELEAFRIDGPPTDCAQFDVTVGVLSGAMRSPIFGAEVTPGVALVGTDLESFFTLSFGDVSLVEAQPTQSYRAMARAGSDVLWFGSDFGRFARGHFAPTLAIDQSYTTPSGGQIRWVAAGPPEDGTDVFLLSWDGVLEHFDGARTSVAYTIGAASGPENAGALAHVGPREAIVAWPAVNRAVVRAKYFDGRWEATTEPTSGSAAFISAAYNPSFGEVVGNSNGEFYRRAPGRDWAPLEGSPLHVWAFSLAAYEDGFVYGSAFGNFGQYTPSAGFCPLQVAQANDVRRIVVVGRDIVLLGPSTRQPSYAWLHRR